MNKKPRRMHLDERVLRVPIKIYDERIAICKNCYAYNSDQGGMCKVVGASVSAKCALKAGACPMGFWSSYYGS